MNRFAIEVDRLDDSLKVFEQQDVLLQRQNVNPEGESNYLNKLLNEKLGDVNSQLKNLDVIEEEEKK